MPAVNFKVTWPDGDVITYYSPSTTIHKYIQKEAYSLENFKTRCDTALTAASERVYQRFGYYCSAASDEQQKIQEKYTDIRKKNITGKVIVNNIS